MRLLKAAFLLLLIWTGIVFTLFGPSVFLHVIKNSDEITEKKELVKYDGFVVKSLKTDLFGNWVVAKKGREEVVFKCDDNLFSSLSVSDSLSQ